MLIIDSERGRSARIVGSRSVTLYRHRRKAKVFRTWRMHDAQAIARFWIRDRQTLAYIANSWRAKFYKQKLKSIKQFAAKRQSERAK